MSQLANIQVTNRELLERVEGDPTVVPARRTFVGKYRRIKGLVTPSLSASFYYFWSQSHQELADDFFQALVSGENLYVGHPVYTLRERLLKSKSSRTLEMKAIDKAAITIMAWNKYRHNESTKNLFWRRFGPVAMPFPSWED